MIFEAGHSSVCALAEDGILPDGYGGNYLYPVLCMDPIGKHSYGCSVALHCIVEKAHPVVAMLILALDVLAHSEELLPRTECNRIG